VKTSYYLSIYNINTSWYYDTSNVRTYLGSSLPRPRPPWHGGLRFLNVKKWYWTALKFGKIQSLPPIHMNLVQWPKQYYGYLGLS